MSPRRFCVSLLLAGFLLSPLLSSAQGITVAAAADLQFAFKDVAARFQAKTGTEVKLSFGSSGNFFAQIQNGAPFDVFFSADVDYPRKLIAAGVADPASLYQYGIGRIVLWVPKDSPIAVERGLSVLLDSSVHKIAIANPEHAPYGRAAVAALKHEGLYDKVQDKLVLGENISQTASFVMSRSADTGIVALSLALSPSMKDGKYFEIPASDHPPIEQAAVLVKASQHLAQARQFLEFIKSPEIVDVLKSYGFSVPSNP